jgi:hypothetical protein
MAWVNFNDLKRKLAADLSLDGPQALAPKWEEHARSGLAWAQVEIERVLAARGYSPAQAAAWQQGSAYHEVIAELHALEKGGGLGEVGKELLDYLKGLRDTFYAGVLVTDADGVPVEPANAGRVGSGEMVGKSVFRDPRLPPRPFRPGLPDWQAKFPPW